MGAIRTAGVSRLPALALFACLAVSGPAAAEVHYRWVNERGNPVHSDHPPPPGTDYEVVDVGPSLYRPVKAEEGVVPLETKPSAGNEFEPVPQIEAPPEKNPVYCQRARDNLVALQSARVRVRNDAGEYYYIDEEEKEAQRQQAREAIEAYCEE